VDQNETTTIIDHADIFRRASRTLARSTIAPAIQQDPSQSASGFEGEGHAVYVLRNARGELARFAYDATADKLTRIEAVEEEAPAAG
jgi:hypothetical protein